MSPNQSPFRDCSPGLNRQESKLSIEDGRFVSRNGNLLQNNKSPDRQQHVSMKQLGILNAKGAREMMASDDKQALKE